MDLPVRIEMLGGMRVRIGETVTTRFRTYKAAALLAHLALHPNQQHDREGLADLFWPDADLEFARASLRTALSSLRGLLKDDGESLLVSQGKHSISLNAARIQTDVAAFEAAIRAKRWEEARRLYTGPLLPGFYEEWVLLERERLEALAETAASHAEAVAASSLTTNPPAVLLPAESTRFFGRDEELQRLGELLSRERLVTLTGPGGIGKTRLAIAAARRHAADGNAAVAFVPLSEISDARRIPDRIREALGLPGQAQTSPMDQVVEYLTAGTFLLVMDNFEQLAADGAATIQTLLSRAPSLACLVTSRRRLGIAREQPFPVQPLPEEVSVPFFVERARAVHPSLVMTEGKAQIVATLCRELDGIPLAIELAAARAQSLSLTEIRERLTAAQAGAERFELLSTRRADKSARHRSLWTTIDWSFRLLTPDQQRLFRRLAVFRGGWTTDAAADICEEPFALEYLAQLRERSLIDAEEREETVRWRMLETLREFAAQQLAAGERERLTERHTSWFGALLETASPHLQTQQSVWLRRMDSDNDNVREALETADPETRLRICAHYWPYWENRGYFDEGRAQLWASLRGLPPEAPLALQARAWTGLGVLAYHQGDHAAAEAAMKQGIVAAAECGAEELRAKLLNNLGLLRIRQNNLEEARRCLTEAEGIQVALGDRRGISSARTNLGIVAFRSEDLEAARSHYEAALAIDRALEDERGIAYLLNNLGNVHSMRGDLDAARGCHEESLAIKRALGHRSGEASSLSNLGIVALQQGHLVEAEQLQKEALRLRQELGLQTGIIDSFVNLASVALAADHAKRAACLWGAVDALLPSLNLSLNAQQREERQTEHARTRAALGAAVFERFLTAGRSLERDAAIAFALSDAHEPVPS